MVRGKVQVKNKTILKIAILVVLALVLITVNNYIVNMVVADSAVWQLENSDSSYLGFKSVQQIGTILFIIWTIVAISLFFKRIAKFITNLFKGDK